MLKYLRTKFEYYETYVQVLTVLWVILSIPYTIISVLIIVQPFWLVVKDDNRAYLGPYKICTYDNVNEFRVSEHCYGGLWSIFEGKFSIFLKIATISLVVSCVFAIFANISMILFLKCGARCVYFWCGLMQFFSFTGIFITEIIYPISWNDAVFRSMCGPKSGIFSAGWCHLTWTYVLSILATFDILCLTVLAVFLAICRPKGSVEKRLDGANKKDNFPYGDGFTVFSTSRDLHDSKFETNYQRAENNQQNYQERCI